MDKFKDRFNILKNIRLGAGEKSQIRQNLVSFMEDASSLHERKTSFIRHIQQEGLLSVIKQRSFAMPAIILALIIALSGGTAFAAQGSLPGDSLYAVKTDIVEQVRVASKISDESKAEFRISLAEDRLEEAEELASQGRLNGEALEVIKSNFKMQEERLASLIENLEAKGNHEAAARLSSHLEASIQTHKTLLTFLTENQNEEESDEEVEELLEDLEEVEDNAEEGREQNEEEVSKHPQSQKAAQGRKKGALNKIESTQRFISKFENRLGEEAVLEAQSKLDEARDFISQGEAEIEAGNYGEAFVLFQKAHRMSQQAKIMVQVQHKLKVRGPKFDNDSEGSEQNEEDTEEEQEESDDEEDDSEEEDQDETEDSEENEESEEDEEVEVSSLDIRGVIKSGVKIQRGF